MIQGDLRSVGRIGCEEGKPGIGKYTVKKASDFPVPSRDITKFFFTVSV
jgi:hypothetical protein